MMAIEADALDLPFEAAISFLKQKINVSTKHWYDVYGAAHSHSFMVAGAAGDAIVADFRKEIESALGEGTTLEDFRKGFDDIVARHGWEYNGSRNWRTRIIFETNLRSAYAAGRYHELTKPETLRAFPFWQYNHSGAVHPRKEHLALDGNVYRASDEVWHVIYPPNGYHCGCFVTPVSGPDLKRQGKNGPDIAPDLRLPGGGYQGVDKGFAWNPGQRWLSGGRPGQKIAALKKVGEFSRRAMAGELPVNATVPVADVPEAMGKALGLPKKSAARLSVQTIRDHIGRKEITGLDYAKAAPAAIDNLGRDAKGRLTALVSHDGKPHVAGFKVTRFGELLMTTLHLANESQIKRLRKMPGLLD